MNCSGYRRCAVWLHVRLSIRWNSFNVRETKTKSTSPGAKWSRQRELTSGTSLSDEADSLEVEKIIKNLKRKLFWAVSLPHPPRVPPLLPIDFPSWFKLPAVSQTIKVLRVWSLEDPSQRGFWKLGAFASFYLCEIGWERTGSPNPGSHSAGTGWKYVLLVPSSGHSGAELEKTFFTLSWVLSASEKLFCNLSVALGLY